MPGIQTTLVLRLLKLFRIEMGDYMAHAYLERLHYKPILRFLKFGSDYIVIPTGVYTVDPVYANRHKSKCNWFQIAGKCALQLTITMTLSGLLRMGLCTFHNSQ